MTHWVIYWFTWVTTGDESVFVMLSVLDSADPAAGLAAPPLALPTVGAATPGCWTGCWVWWTPASVRTAGRSAPPGSGWGSPRAGPRPPAGSVPPTAGPGSAACPCSSATRQWHHNIAFIWGWLASLAFSEKACVKGAVKTLPWPKLLITALMSVMETMCADVMDAGLISHYNLYLIVNGTPLVVYVSEILSW